MTPAERALMNAHAKMIQATRYALSTYDVRDAASVGRLVWAQRNQALVASKRLDVTRKAQAARQAAR